MIARRGQGWIREQTRTYDASAWRSNSVSEIVAIADPVGPHVVERRRAKIKDNSRICLRLTGSAVRLPFASLPLISARIPFERLRFPVKKFVSLLVWLGVALLGAFGYWTIATQRHEPVNSGFILIAALCTYAIGYRFYSKWIAAQVLALDDRRATPCEVHEDGKDFVKTNKWIVFGHHFAAISGPGPLVGPVLAAQFGYLPGTLWIFIGVVLGGAVQDFIILFASHAARWQIARADGEGGAELGGRLHRRHRDPGDHDHPAGGAGAGGGEGAGGIARGASSPWARRFPSPCSWAVSARSCAWARCWKSPPSAWCCCCSRCGAGNSSTPIRHWHSRLPVKAEPLAWAIIVYGFLASVLPVWLLLAPRDYLSTFMKLGTIFALALGIFLVLPTLHMPAVSKFVDGSGPVVPGKLFPFCFITIACGAISGFHTLISSGITPKIITRESYARPVGYGAMCLESLVAIMAMIAACTLDPGVYLAMNIPGGDPVATQAAVAASGLTQLVPGADGQYTNAAVTVAPEAMKDLATQMGEVTLFGRTGGAATLAVGMAHDLLEAHARALARSLVPLRDHVRGAVHPHHARCRHARGPLSCCRMPSSASSRASATPKNFGAGRDRQRAHRRRVGLLSHHGRARSRWRRESALAHLRHRQSTARQHRALPCHDDPAQDAAPARKSPALAFVTLVPLAWLLAVTISASVIKIWDPNPKIGFLAGAHAAEAKLLTLQTTRCTTPPPRRSKRAQTLHFNSIIDAWVTGIFLALVGA